MSNDEVTIEAIEREYKACKSVREVARRCRISESAVKRLLISSGIYPSARAKQIADAVGSGASHEEIARAYNIKRKSLSLFLPCRRGPYAIGPKSPNAKRISNWRRKAKAQQDNDQGRS